MEPESFLELLKQKGKEREEIEREITATADQMKLFNHCKFEEALVDREGFPRADIDFMQLSQYRTLKNKRNIFIEKAVLKRKELETDHQIIMKEIEKNLESYHESLAKSQKAKEELEKFEASIPDRTALFEERERLREEQMRMEAAKEMETSVVPFARIIQVLEGSPADTSGLREKDLVFQYGECNYLNHNNLSQIAVETKKSIGGSIKAGVLREESEGESTGRMVEHEGRQFAVKWMSVAPRVWEGDGVLGYYHSLFGFYGFIGDHLEEPKLSGIWCEKCNEQVD